jgi:Dna[CI] antecedent, DciA
MRKTRSVSELLAEGKAALERLKTGAEAANRALVALQRALPADIAPHVFGATLDPEGVLTVLVDSGAFATRLRFLLPELLPALAATLEGGAITRTVVRVRPRG